MTTAKKDTAKRKPKAKITEQIQSKEDIVEVQELVQQEDKLIHIFMKQNAFIPGFALYIHKRYGIPESRLKEIPKDNYILLED
jgi:hypothetical protein